MTHTLTLVDENEVFRRLKNHPPKAYGIHTSSRWLNKELKFLFSTLHRTLWKNVLEKLQLTLQSSNKRPAWTRAFVALLLLAMVIESMQVQIRCKEESDKRDGMRAKGNDDASSEIGHTDEKWRLLRDLYHKKYKAFNPIYQDNDRQMLDPPMQELAQQVKALAEKHGEHLLVIRHELPCWCANPRLGPLLESRRMLGPPATSREPNASRLVADLLLSLKPKFGPAVAARARR